MMEFILMERENVPSVPRIAGVYMIRNNKNGKVYVGSSTNIRRRLSDYLCRLNQSKYRNERLQSDWIAYGSKCFEFGLIEEVPPVKTDADIKELRKLERKWIHFHKSCDVLRGY